MDELVVDEESGIARIGEHEFDVSRMLWICECGTEMEVDAETCGSCETVNPFLGILI